MQMAREMSRNPHLEVEGPLRAEGQSNQSPLGKEVHTLEFSLDLQMMLLSHQGLWIVTYVHVFRRRLEFDPDKLMVDDLREELRLRGLPASGSKPALLQRLQEAVTTKSDTPLQRLV